MFWGAVFIIVGLVLAFLGNKFITLMVGIVSALGVFIGGLYLTTMIVDSTMKETEIKDYAVWIILALWAIAAGVAGWFMAKKKKWGIALIGAFAGAMGGMLITTMFVIGSTGLYYGLIAGCAVAGFIVTFYVETFVIIASTSFIGSYAVVRGISMYAGHFPNEQELHVMA